LPAWSARIRRATLFAFVATTALSGAVSAQEPPPTLVSAAGGSFPGVGHEGELNGIDVQFIYDIDCQPDGTSTLSWATSWTEPYHLIGYGDTSYRESGSITIGPNVVDEQYREIESSPNGYWEYNRDAPILDFDASFEFTYDGVIVVGTRHSPTVQGSAAPRAACGNSVTDLTGQDGNPGDPDDHFGNLLWSDFRLYSEFDATYTTGNGAYAESGLAITDLEAFYDVGDGNRMGLLQTEYVSGGGPVPDSPDADGDGIDDSVDTGDGTFASGVTSGAITDAAGHSVTVAPEGSNEVRISVAGTGTARATLTVCGFTLRLAPGSEVVVGCGSITVQVISGAAELVLGGGLTTVTVPAGVSATLKEQPDGGFSLTDVTGGSLTVTVDGVSSTVQAGQSLTLQAWDFIGFESPVDNGGVLNVVKAGSAVPLKWRILDAAGAPVTGLDDARVTVASLACSAGSSADQLEELAAGGSALQNLGDGYYQLNWKTPKSYANSCKTLRLEIGDGVLHTALFSFTK
jgi:hypothetical protein